MNGVYTQAFNRQHNKVGHLLQGRFNAILVDRDAYLPLTLSSPGQGRVTGATHNSSMNSAAASIIEPHRDALTALC